MVRLTMLLFSIIGTSLMGLGVIVVLAAGWVSAQSIIIAAAVGFLLGLPISFLVAKKLA